MRQAARDGEAGAMIQLLAGTSRPGPRGARVAWPGCVRDPMVVATTAATTHQVKNMHSAGARALAVLESPNRRGWGLLERFGVEAVLARGAACELTSCVLTIVVLE